MNNYIGKIRLVKQPEYISRIPDTRFTGSFRTETKYSPPKLQQFDGKDWVDVEIVELEDQVTI